MMVAFWFLSGVITVILNEGILFFLYMPTGLGMMIYGYLIRNKTEEFISWNNTGILINDIAYGKLSYAWQDVDAMFISKNHLTIKSGAANGIILDLVGYSEEDIELLQTGVMRDPQVQIATSN